MTKLFYGPILYFKMKSYIKGVLWLLIILAALPTNFFMALLFWIIAGWFGKKKLTITRKQDSMHIPAHSDGESGIIRTLFRRYPDSDSDV